MSWATTSAGRTLRAAAWQTPIRTIRTRGGVLGATPLMDSVPAAIDIVSPA